MYFYFLKSLLRIFYILYMFCMFQTEDLYYINEEVAAAAAAATAASAAGI